MINLKKGVNPFQISFHENWLNRNDGFTNLGSFHTLLMEAFTLADSDNRDTLTTAFPEYFDKLHKPGSEFEREYLREQLSELFTHNTPAIKAIYGNDKTKYLTGLEIRFDNHDYNQFIQFSKIGEVIDTIKEHYLNLCEADLVDITFETYNSKKVWGLTTTIEL